MIRESIAKLAEGQKLSREEAHGTMLEIMSGEATPAQIASYITALRIRGEPPEVIAGSAAAMREKFTAVRAPTDIVVDTCGTGGDGAHTFNISTCSALVAAGAGVTVAKHGNRSVSSKCGSADVLGALGVKVDATPNIMEDCLKSVGIAFLFAPVLHPAMKHAIGPRREIGIRSIFNILGPLSNPAGARYGVLGVYDRELAFTLAEAAAALGAKRLFVVHGFDGLDEITTTGPTRVADVKDGVVTTYEIKPDDFGIPTASRNDLTGGEAAENAELIRRILAGEKGPRRDIVLLNAAAAIVAGQKAKDLKEGIAAAARSIDSGAAKQKLEKLIELTQKTS
jgi:anthranilate phosphoribosyltransferase